MALRRALPGVSPAGLSRFAALALALLSAGGAIAQVPVAYSGAEVHPLEDTGCSPRFVLPGASDFPGNRPPPTNSAFAGSAAGSASASVNTPTGMVSAAATSTALLYDSPCVSFDIWLSNSARAHASFQEGYSIAGPHATNATGYLRFSVGGEMVLGPSHSNVRPAAYMIVGIGATGAQPFGRTFSHSPLGSPDEEVVGPSFARTVDVPVNLSPNASSQDLPPGISYNGGSRFGTLIQVSLQPVTAAESTASGTLSASLLLPAGFSFHGSQSGFPMPVFTLQTISLESLLDRQLGGAPFSLSATASSGLPVTFASLTPTVCSVSGTTVTLAAPGTCTITATQSGDATYASAVPVTQSFTVAAATSSQQVPLPLWALALQALLLAAAGTWVARRRRLH
jgi:hypothetical protein